MKNLCLIGFLCVIFVGITYGFVAGIDFGSDTFKIAYVRIGNPPILIAVNSISSRKTESVVAIRDGVRLFGADATALNTRFPQLVYGGLTALIGRKKAALAEFEDAFSPPYQVLEDPVRGSLLFNDLDSGKMNFTTEELLGTIIDSALSIAKANSHEMAPVKDAVLTVPDFFDIHQRESIGDACKIAGVPLLGLINENTAVALQYGLERRSQFSTNTSHVLIIYNMGASHLTVSAAQFSVVLDKKNTSMNQVEVIAKAWDETLGGHSFDVALAEHFEQVFLAKHKSIAKLSDKAKAKLLKEANKVKEVLSANTDTIASVEALQDDIDFSLPITRVQFEKICEPLLNRATKPLEQVLEMLGDTPIDAIELMGGGARVQRIIEAVNAVLAPKGHTLGKHLNGDETAALGAGFFAAMKSSQFKAKPVKVIDKSSYGIEVSWAGTASAEAREKTLLFPAGSKATKKVVSVAEVEDFVARMSYEPTAKLPVGVDHDIVEYNITGVKKNLEGKILTTKAKVSLSFKLTESETVQLQEAELIFDEEKVVREEISQNKTENADAKKDSSDETEDAAKAAEDKAAAEGDEEKGEKTEKAEKQYRNVTKVFSRTIPLTVTTIRLGLPDMPPAQYNAARDRLRRFQVREDGRARVDSARNNLETLIYALKAQIENSESDRETLIKHREDYIDQLMSPKAKPDDHGDLEAYLQNVYLVMSDDQRENITGEIAAAEDWLYSYNVEEDYADEKEKEKDSKLDPVQLETKLIDKAASAFGAKLRKVEKIFSPYSNRLKEFRSMPKALNSSMMFVQESLNLLDQWQKDLEKNEGSEKKVNVSEIAPLRERVADFKEYVTERLKKQVANLKAYNNDNELVSENIWKRLNTLAERFKEFATKVKKATRPSSKPKPKAEKKPETKKPKKDSEDKPEEEKPEDANAEEQQQQQQQQQDEQQQQQQKGSDEAEIQDDTANGEEKKEDL